MGNRFTLKEIYILMKIQENYYHLLFDFSNKVLLKSISTLCITAICDTVLRGDLRGKKQALDFLFQQIPYIKIFESSCHCRRAKRYKKRLPPQYMRISSCFYLTAFTGHLQVSLLYGRRYLY